MKSNFYWFKVGLLIGAGLLLGYWAMSLAGFLLIPAVLLIPVAVLFLLVALGGRLIGKTISRFQGNLRLRQGWANRARL